MENDNQNQNNQPGNLNPDEYDELLPIFRISSGNYIFNIGESFQATLEITNVTYKPIVDVHINIVDSEGLELSDWADRNLGRLDPSEIQRFSFSVAPLEDGHWPITWDIEYRVHDGSTRTTRFKSAPIQVSLQFPTLPTLWKTELGVLNSLWDRTRRDGLRVATILGERGVGKSTLGRLFFEAIQSSPVGRPMILKSRCAEGGLFPLSPITQWVKAFLSATIPASTLSQILKDKLKVDINQFRHQEVYLPTLLQLVFEYRGTFYPTTALGSETLGNGNESIDHRQEILMACSDVFHWMADSGSLILSLEDAQYMSRDAMNLLLAIVKQLTPRHILLVIEMGPDPGEEAGNTDKQSAINYSHVLRGIGRIDHHAVFLNPLTTEATKELFDFALKGHVINAHDSEQILIHSQGLPYLLIETLKIMRLQGRLKRIQGCWSLVETNANDSIRITIESMARERFDTLSPDLRNVIQNASVLGARFRGDILFKLYEKTEKDIDRAKLIEWVDHLETVWHMIRWTGDDIEFVNRHIRDIVYRELTPELRKELHSIVASVYETMEHSYRFSDYLAYHWTEAEQYDRAIDWYNLCVEQHVRQGAYHEAITILKKVIELCQQFQSLKDKHWVFKRSRELSRLLHYSGEVRLALQNDKINLKRAEELQAWSDSCDIYRQLSNLSLLIGDQELAVEYARKGKVLAQAKGVPKQMIELTLQLGLLERKRLHLARAEKHFFECLEWKEVEGAPSWLEAETRRNIGILRRMQGRNSEAMEAFQSAADILLCLPEKARTHGLAMTYDNMAALYVQLGNLDEAWNRLEDSLELRNESGDAVGLSRGLHGQAEICFLKGEFDKADEKVKTSIAWKEKLGDREGLALGYILQGNIALGRNNHEEAEMHFENAYAIFKELHLEWRAAIALTGMAECALIRGDLEASEARLQPIRNLDKSDWDMESKAAICLVEANLSRRKGDYPTSRSFIESYLFQQREALKPAQRIELTIAEVLLLVSEGDQSRKAGAIEEANDAWVNASGILGEAMGTPEVDKRLYLKTRILNILGKIELRLGNLLGAKSIFEENIRCLDQIDDPLGRALALDGMGKIEMSLEHYATAKAHFMEARTIKSKVGDLFGIERSDAYLAKLESLHNSE